MSLEILSIDSDDSFELPKWLEGKKNNRLQRPVEEKIVNFLFNNELHKASFKKMAARWLRIDMYSENRAALVREIAQLNISADGSIELSKSKLRAILNRIYSFVSAHKGEILLGAASCAPSAGLAYVASCSVGARVFGMTTPEADLRHTSDEETPSQCASGNTQVCSKQDLDAIQTSRPSLLVPLARAERGRGNRHVYSNQILEQPYFPNKLARSPFFSPLLSAPRLQSAPSDAFTSREQKNIPNLLYNQENATSINPLSPSNASPRQIVSNPFITAPVISQKFILEGTQNAYGHIGWINGINNTFEDFKNSGLYLQSLAEGHTISGIYNCSHHVTIDLLETAFFNHNGFSPIIGKLLENEWAAFHKINAHRPNLKCLQICHSQGAIHVRNALRKLPEEIRNRIIVVAIAPGAIVPKELCFKSFNYASEKDIVYKFEPSRLPIFESNSIDEALIHRFEMRSSPHKDQLIILPSDPKATGIDHFFQSPTYIKALKAVIDDYKNHGGEYLPHEKGNKTEIRIEVDNDGSGKATVSAERDKEPK